MFNTFSLSSINTRLKWVCDRCVGIKFLYSESGRQSPAVDCTSGVISPVRNCLGFSKYGYSSVAYSVSGLRLIVNESAIVWAVAIVIIFSIYTQALKISIFSGPNLECPKVCQPLTTNFNATSTPSSIIFSSLAVAPFFHATPNSVERAFVRWSGNTIHTPTGIITAGAGAELSSGGRIGQKRLLAVDTGLFNHTLIYHVGTYANEWIED